MLINTVTADDINPLNPSNNITVDQWICIIQDILGQKKVSNKNKKKSKIIALVSTYLRDTGNNLTWLNKKIDEHNYQVMVAQEQTLEAIGANKANGAPTVANQTGANESLQSNHLDPFNNSKKVTRTPPKNRSIRAPIHSYHNYNAGLKETRNQPKRAQSMYLAPILSSQDTHNQHDSEDDAILPNETRDTFSITRDSYAVDNTITLDNTFTLDHREQMIVLSAYPMATSCGYVPRFSIKELQNALNKLEHNKLLTTNTNNQVFAASEIIVRDLADCGRLINSTQIMKRKNVENKMLFLMY